MLEDEFKKLLEKTWDTEEKELVTRIMEGLLYYKRFLPKTFKNDVFLAIKLCNKLKNELEETKNELEEAKKENEKNENIGNIEFDDIIDKDKIIDNKLESLKSDIEELKLIILVDKKSKTSIKYKMYKKILQYIYKNVIKNDE